ncbi:zinc finger protein 282-like [Neopsephotus bourkii]|uniref:zinc finger protein 282-like n=1 Tax=Neopsephotus bourkii TaxID=309878 RepID=UPI002AA5544F|nr:zinc finger protein 282-like [Neopsephotus bourkii]
MEPPHPASCGFPVEPPAAGGCPKLCGSRVSLKTALAAVQTVEQSVDAHGSRLLNLESRVAATEKNHLGRGKTVVEFGSQLESKCAALGTLIQEYGQLQRSLENMENLLKSGNLRILQPPPGSRSPGYDSLRSWRNLGPSRLCRDPDPSWLMENPGSLSAPKGSLIPLVSAVPRTPPSPPACGRRSACGGAPAGGAAVPGTEAAAAAAGVGGAGGAAMAGPEAERAEAQAVAARLLRLESRLARAERQLRAALALRGRLQALERRLETGGGCSGCCGGAPRMSAKRWAAGGGRRAARPRAGQGPVSLEDVWLQFSEREWRALRGWQQALHWAVMRSNYHMLLSLEPDAPRRDTQARSEDAIQPSVQSCADGDGRDDPEESEDSIIHIKQEEELASADQQEGEAGKAPEEPCPAEQAFYEPESSNQPKKGKEVHARELPGMEGEDLPGDPDAGFQTYATDVLSWIKQEEEPRCPEQRDLEKEVSADPSTAHDENTKRDPPAGCFESTARDSEVPGRPGEQFSKDPSPGVTWDSQWNSEMMETNTAGNSLGDDAQHTRGFGEHLDFFSTQENSVGKRPCSYNKQERNSTQQEYLQAPQGAREGDVSPELTCERSLNERAFRVLHSQPCAAGEKRGGQGPASACYEGLPMGPQLATHPDCGQNPAGEPGLHEHHGLGGEEQLPAESEENFPAENPLASPCWDHPQDKAEACSRCQQHLAPRGSPAGQQQSQGRGKSYICSDCGKGFVCHSWLVRHQMTHTGERPYKCSECDKSYRRKDYLLNHLRRHSGERLFQCSLCRKRFVLRRSLVKHQESHLQETHLALASWPCTEMRGAVMHSI